MAAGHAPEIVTKDGRVSEGCSVETGRRSPDAEVAVSAPRQESPTMGATAAAGSTPEEVLAMGATMEAREPEGGRMEDEAQTSEANIDGPPFGTQVGAMRNYAPLTDVEALIVPTSCSVLLFDWEAPPPTDCSEGLSFGSLVDVNVCDGQIECTVKAEFLDFAEVQVPLAYVWFKQE